MKFAGKPLLLMILDGWGMRENTAGDALAMAKVPNFDGYWRNFPHADLGCAGVEVGLPEGQMGDSEVGHMNIGAGRVVYQDYTRISRAVNEGSFFTNSTLIEAMDMAKEAGKAVHIFGLVSDGGIHSHISHLFALLKIAKEQKIGQVFIHCFTDGRDTNSNMAEIFINQLEDVIATLGVGKIASLAGRFYGMDRDKRWERVQKAYEAMVYAEGHMVSSAAEAIQNSYAKGNFDEFIEPSIMVDEKGKPIATIKEGDTVICFNYRSDRVREISHAFTDEPFGFFDRGEGHPHTNFVCMTNYDDTLNNVMIVYPPSPPINTLGRVLSRNGLRQLRIAETEKYAHITFFFNGGVEKMENGEDRVMIPSPNVKTYDMEPRMNAAAVTRAVIDRVKSEIYDVIVINFANPDMIGHTGNIPATIESLEYVDECMRQIIDAVREKGGTAIITADHGNVERMIDDNGEPMTSHTTNKVPFILVDDNFNNLELRADGKLEDIAPTILQLLGIKQPAEMTGKSLISSGLTQFDQLTL
jgi:2,3-bisphosphoglycerate-independent phosphoglycerate mutase